MDLWIRSQDRQDLILAKHITVETDCVYVLTTDDYRNYVGEYETKERALEVLDEIQNLIKNGTKIILQPKSPAMCITKEDFKKFKRMVKEDAFSIIPDYFIVNKIDQEIVYEMPKE